MLLLKTYTMKFKKERSFVRPDFHLQLKLDFEVNIYNRYTLNCTNFVRNLAMLKAVRCLDSHLNILQSNTEDINAETVSSDNTIVSGKSISYSPYKI